MLSIDSIEQGVRDIASDYPIKKVDLFGSYAQKKQTDKSDVDLLIEFEPAMISLLILSELRLRLEEKLGLDVDVVRAPIPQNSFIEIGKTVTLYER